MEKEIQKRIRRYRNEKGLTLRELAQRAGCTHSYISQVEKGMTVPSLSMVGKLAAALGISVVDLFNEVPDASESDWHLTEKARKTINYPDGKVTSELLVSRIATKKMEPIISRIEPGGRSDAAEGLNHPPGTEEFVLVLKGAIDFEINGLKMHLQEGDSLSFDGNLSHNWVNNENERAEVLFVFSPPIW